MTRPYRYKIHDELADKKLLRTITKEEEKELEKVRNEKNRVAIYQKILDEMEEIKRIGIPKFVKEK